MAKKAGDAVGTVMELLKEHSVEYVDLRFTDPRGKWQHTAQHVSTIDDEAFRDGIMFDGSSIAGWKAINESDMILLPDAETAVMDPFAAKPSLILFCDIIEPSTGQPYNRDPRSTAKKAEQDLLASGIGDTCFVGPEAEFFVFDSVRFGVGGNYAMYQLDSQEGPQASLKDYPEGNMGHRPAVKGGYFPVPPVDAESDLRAEMLSTMGEMGVAIEKHHHEVAQGQHELGMKFGPLVRMADHLQIYKYCIHNVAHSYGKTATFMPKPVYGDNGSGHACAPVDLEERQAAVRRQRVCRSIGIGAVLHRRHHQACQGAERLHQSADQQLQAADPGLRGAGAAGLLGAQPLGVVPDSRMRQARRPSASRCGFPIRGRTRIWRSPRC